MFLFLFWEFCSLRVRAVATQPDDESWTLNHTWKDACGSVIPAHIRRDWRKAWKVTGWPHGSWNSTIRQTVPQQGLRWQSNTQSCPMTSACGPHTHTHARTHVGMHTHMPAHINPLSHTHFLKSKVKNYRRRHQTLSSVLHPQHTNTRVYKNSCSHVHTEH